MDAKDEVKRRLSVEEVVGDYLELKRAGRNFKASSPFTAEKTPSFMVSPEKQIWHDFSSNKGGDIFSFIMEVEGVEFREALEILARKANVELSEYGKSDGSTAKLKKQILEANNLACQFYHLHLSKNTKALSYIKQKRNFNPTTIRAWKLGYAPGDGTALLQFLKKRGFSEEALSKAGLITKRRSGWGDMFRGRVMIPLSDGQGRVVGFTARLLDPDDTGPKYFNTPQTLLYDKGRQVFGLHLAKEAIRKEDRAVLVEGNLDVIASWQAGVTNVVACAGTAVTSDHFRVLSRLSPNISLAFDADSAGINASERAISIAQKVGVELTIVSMPEDVKDPDELITKNPELWKKAITSAKDAVSWTLENYEKQYDKRTAQGKRQLSTKALAVIRGLSDPVEREYYIKKLADTLDTSESSLVAKLQTQKSTTNTIRKKLTHVVAAGPDKLAYEDEYLALNCMYPDVRDSLKQLKKDSLHTPRRQAVFEQLLTLKPNERLTESVAQRLQLDTNYVKILALTVEERYASFNPAALISEAMALSRRIQKNYDREIKTQLTEAIAEAEERGEHQKANQLLKEYQALLREE